MHSLSTNNQNLDFKSSTPALYTRFKNMLSGDFSNLDLDEKDDDMGIVNKDEDRTVTTGLSRRPGLARLNSVTNYPLDVPPPLVCSSSQLDKLQLRPPTAFSTIAVLLSLLLQLPTTIAGNS
jgi:hypothetical protein